MGKAAALEERVNGNKNTVNNIMIPCTESMEESNTCQVKDTNDDDATATSNASSRTTTN